MVSYSVTGASHFMLEKMRPMKEILLIGVSCEMCEQCGALAFKAERR
jgi:hypothetical protein